jgi:MscS family membrane protein
VNYKRILKLIIWSLLLLGCIYLRFYYPLEESVEKSRVIHTILSLCILLLTFRVVIHSLILLYKLDRRKGDGKLRDNLIVGLSNLFSIFSFMAVGLALLSLFGLEITTVFTSLSIVAAAIAIISKEFIMELYIGLLYGFSRKVEIQDYVKVGEQRGKIMDIGLQKITLLNDDDYVVFIPNTKFYNSEVINYSKRDLNRMSVDFQLDIQYLQSLEHLEKMLVESISEFHDQIVPESFNLKVKEIKMDYIDFKFQYVLKEVDQNLQKSIRKFTLRKIIDFINTLRLERGKVVGYG